MKVKQTSIGAVLIGISSISAYVVLSGNEILLLLGVVISLGGVGSGIAHKLGQTRIKSAAPLAVATLIGGVLVAWRGYQTNSVLWIAFGIGVAVALAVVMLFPDQLSIVWGMLGLTFGGAGLWLAVNGTILTGIVLVGWSVLFGRKSKQNWSSATT